jgi:hypothetical protein
MFITVVPSWVVITMPCSEAIRAAPVGNGSAKNATGTPNVVEVLVVAASPVVIVGAWVESMTDEVVDDEDVTITELEVDSERVDAELQAATTIPIRNAVISVRIPLMRL